MPDGWIEGIFTLPVFLYLFSIAAGQIAVSATWDHRRRHRARQRTDAGVAGPGAPAPDLDDAEGRWRGGALLATSIGVPWLVWLAAGLFGGLAPAALAGLVVTTLAIVLALAVFGRDAARAFVGGLAYRVTTKAVRPGAIVAIDGRRGQVTRVGTFATAIATECGGGVHIPTVKLWSTTIEAVSSLCRVEVPIADGVAAADRARVEERVRETVETSPHADPESVVETSWDLAAGRLLLAVQASATSPLETCYLRADMVRRILDLADPAIALGAVTAATGVVETKPPRRASKRSAPQAKSEAA